MSQRKRKKRPQSLARLWGALGLSLLCLLCCAWLVFEDLFAPLRKESSFRVEISDYRGRVLQQTQFPDWVTTEIAYRYDEKTPSGVILSQSPEGGSCRKLTSEAPTVPLRLQVSLGREHLLLPSVYGMSLSAAKGALREGEFTVQVEMRESAYEEGTVFATEPRGGERLPRGSVVTLYVSRGVPEQSVRVPQLVGMTRGDALMSLWLAGLATEEIVEVPTRDATVGTVIRQSHQADTLVRAGTRITLYIASASDAEGASGEQTTQSPIASREHSRPFDTE